MDVWPKTRPKFLRNPGQYIDEQIDRLINDKFLAFYLFASAFWFIAFLCQPREDLQQHVRNRSPG